MKKKKKEKSPQCYNLCLLRTFFLYFSCSIISADSLETFLFLLYMKKCVLSVFEPFQVVLQMFLWSILLCFYTVPVGVYDIFLDTLSFSEKCLLNLLASLTLLFSYSSLSFLKSLLTGGMLLLYASNMVSILFSNIFLVWLLLLIFLCSPFENYVQLCWISLFVNFMKESWCVSKTSALTSCFSATFLQSVAR